MASPSSLSNFRISPFAGLLENTEFNFRSLYLHHINRGPKQNQISRIGSDGGWGNIVVNNWAIYDGSGPDAALVGHARGLHVNTVIWHNSFTLDFEAGRFTGSTLQIMGLHVNDTDSSLGSEWSIVGGTGDLAMARGVVKRKQHQVIGDGDIQELTIHGFCQIQSFPTLTKTGPWGGGGGFPTDSEQPWRIETITIVYDGVIHSFEYTYFDLSGKRHKEGPWGAGIGENNVKVVLGPNEIMKAVSGSYTNDNNGQTVIQSLTFYTNEEEYGPYGLTTGVSFDADVPKHGSVVGFFGRTDYKYLNALGVYTVV